MYNHVQHLTPEESRAMDTELEKNKHHRNYMKLEVVDPKTSVIIFNMVFPSTTDFASYNRKDWLTFFSQNPISYDNGIVSMDLLKLMVFTLVIYKTLV